MKSNSYFKKFNSVQQFDPAGIYMWEMPIRKATRDRWLKEGLPPDINDDMTLMDYFGIESFYEMGGASHMDPPFEKTILEENDHYQIWIDELGATRKDFKDGLDSGFVTRSWLKFPVENASDFEEIKKRYIVNMNRLRWPEDKLDILKRRHRPVALEFDGLFWKLRDWVGFENLCMWFYDHEKLVRDMLEFWCDFLTATIDGKLDNIPKGAAVPDMVIISEDMAYKGRPMIGPGMMREFMLPHYRKIVDVLKKHGIQYIYVDCDGDPRQLIPAWLEVGINGIYPIEVAAGMDPVELQREYGRDLYMIGGIDKRELAKNKDSIRREVRSKLLPTVTSGGYIPGVDHAVPEDVSLENHAYYIECVREVEKELFS